MTNHLVATFLDRMQVEAAYTALETGGLPMPQVKILGRGYQQLEEIGLFDPNLASRQRVFRMVLWLVPFGFFAGFTFNQVTQLTILPGFSDLANSVIGGLMGAIAGGLGSLTVGDGPKLLLRGQETLPYRDRLQAGKYLLVVSGSETLIRKANNLVRSLDCESLQIYEAPGSEK